MRSYKRKQPQLQVIEGIEELCRLCLNKAKEGVSIFTQDSSKIGTTMPLNHRIMFCVGLEMQQEDCLPNTICMHCHKELERYYMFRKKCEASYHKLKSHLRAVRDRELSKASACLQKEKEQNNNDNLKNSSVDDVELALKRNGKIDIVDNSLIKINEQVNITDKMPHIMDVDSGEYISTTNTNESQQQNKPPPHPNIKEFLTAMLVELGLLSNQGGELIWTDESVNTIQLETGDGRQFNLALAEEQDQRPPTSPFVIIEENTKQQTETKKQEKNGIIVKYIPVSNLSYTEETSKESSSAHGGAHRCNTCGKHLASRSVLRRHQRVHSGERPYACRHCTLRFTQRIVLQRHELLHKDPSSRPFRCGECPKTFTQRGGLAAHVRSHAPPHVRCLPLHRCNKCTKVFLHPSGLSRHMMTHKGRVYVCAVCSKDFLDKSSLQRHIRKFHQGQALNNTMQVKNDASCRKDTSNNT